ncbi:MAG: AmmeMemoRadiSam system protein B [Bacteroidota bacterium]
MTESCHSQNPAHKASDRPAAVAGQFYAGDSLTLLGDLKNLFAKALPCQSTQVLAIIAPHAGYVFSGTVAASSFNQIDAEKEYMDIFVIGSSHSEYFDGAAVYFSGNFVTPLGVVEVDTALGHHLVNTNRVFKNYNVVHAKEHSIEVQLPFLQYHIKKPFRIVPILLGTDDAAVCAEIAQALAPYLNANNLFVISTDFSHYPNYANAVKVDKLSAEAVLSNSAEALLKTLRTNAKLGLPNLATSMCGWTSVLTLLRMSEKMPNMRYTLLQYKNSGDTPVYGDSARVVGYNAMVLTQTSAAETEFALSETDKTQLLQIARNTLTAYVKTGNTPTLDTTQLSAACKLHCGAFVTLRKNGELRGCIGQFVAEKPLYGIVQDMCKAAATTDPRFARVSPEELPRIVLEISVLSPLRKIQSIDEIELGKYGIYIKKGSQTGTFLPQVATETGWTKTEFLSHCAQDKAGLGWNGWKDADIYVYTAIVFEEK